MRRGALARRSFTRSSSAACAACFRESRRSAKLWPGVLAGHLDEADLVAALRDEDGHALPAHLAQIVAAHLGVGDGLGQQDLVGRVVGRRLVELRQHGLEHLGVRELPAVEAVRPVADQLAAADEQHLDLDRAALAVEAEHILVGAPVLAHLLALLGLVDGGDLVAEAGRLLVALVRRRLVHAAAELHHDVAAPALEQQHRLAEVLAVRVPVDRQDARAEAALDLVLDARTAPVPEDRVAARAEREHLPNGVERVAYRRRAGEWAEIAAPVLDDAPRDEDARPRVLQGHLDADVALVVLQPDVVARLVLLDQVVLEDERFLVARGHQRLEVRETVDEEAHLAALVSAAEIRADARAEVRRLADVDHLPVPVLQQVHARARRHGREAVVQRARLGRGGRLEGVVVGPHGEHVIIRRAGRKAHHEDAWRVQSTPRSGRWRAWRGELVLAYQPLGRFLSRPSQVIR
jgi:hypothetical protein